jgi:hypothetical protein
MIKIAMILHFPPVIDNFNTPINKLPVCPGADCLAKMRAGCKFYENGHCIPANLYKPQNEGPSGTLRFEIEPLKEFEEMEPSNPKGAVAAAATYGYLNPNSAIAKTAQSATFGIALALAAGSNQQQPWGWRALSAAGSNQQQP